VIIHPRDITIEYKQCLEKRLVKTITEASLNFNQIGYMGSIHIRSKENISFK
jgi:hypothetical protein